MKKKMNYWMKLGVMAMLSTMVLSLTGCGGKEMSSAEKTENSKPAVAFMVANTANSKEPDFSAPLIQNTVLGCAENFGYSFLVRVDGEPEVIAKEDLDIDEKFKSASQERLKRDACSRATNLLSTFEEVTAVHPEVDYLEGLRLAAASLHSLDDTYTSRTIICTGSGLSTTGYLNFNDNLLSADPEVIVDLLKEREALPDLNGIVVYWLGMSQVKAPQEKLTPKQANTLQTIWQSVVKASGGEFEVNDYISVASELEEPEELPSVSTVELPPEKPMVLETKANLDETAFQEPKMLGEDQIQFVGGEANYLDPESAVETLRPIAEYLNQYKTVNLVLIGTTAGATTDDAMLTLSKQRAETVKKTLVEDLGVEAERLTTVGMGARDPWHIEEPVAYEGAAARANRKVVLIDRSSEQAKQLVGND